MHNCMKPMFGKTPEFYRLSCSKCFWEEDFELEPREMARGALSSALPDKLRHVSVLPKKCPLCGARLRKTKFPGLFRN